MSPETHENVQNIATKDLATEVIQDSLLNARNKGQQQLDTFVKDRLIGQVGTQSTGSI